MIEVFTVNIQSKIQSEQIIQILGENFPLLEINVDLSETKLPFPCGHSILRAEGAMIQSDKIMTQVRNAGFMCEILEDKICN